MTISYATIKDLNWLTKYDYHVDKKILKQKITSKEIILLNLDGKNVGWLRFGLFWDSIPFVNMLFLDEEHRSRGFGKKLVRFWELEMKKRKYKLVMTSTQSDEEAQHFYRKIGYSDVGSFSLPKEPLEFILIKKLR